MNDAVFKFMISRIAEKAKDAIKEANDNSNQDYWEGRKFAYYEILDTIKSELDVRDEDLKEYGIDFDLESSLL